MSNQNVSTPMDLIRAIEERFGPLTIDLAANESNHKAPIWLGPGTPTPDALSLDWLSGGMLRQKEVAWLNNPYANTAKWVRKCWESVTAENSGGGWKILQLIPASVCANYWIDLIDDYAYQIKLTPRPFADEVRDCCLIVWQPEQMIGQETWHWKE